MRELRTIRRESLAATRESRTAMRRERSRQPSWPEKAIYVDREGGKP